MEVLESNTAVSRLVEKIFNTLSNETQFNIIETSYKTATISKSLSDLLPEKVKSINLYDNSSEAYEKEFYQELKNVFSGSKVEHLVRYNLGYFGSITNSIDCIELDVFTVFVLDPYNLGSLISFKKKFKEFLTENPNFRYILVLNSCLSRHPKAPENFAKFLDTELILDFHSKYSPRFGGYHKRDWTIWRKSYEFGQK